jgi:hypothetical protein
MRGGFFKDLVKGVGKVVKTVTRIPVIKDLVKVAIGGIPIVGQVVTAVNAFKGATAAAGSANVAGGVSTPMYGGMKEAPPGFRRPRRRKRAAPRRKKKAKAKRSRKGGSAKQRAARARFARAAKKGRIKKGQRL